MNKSDLINTVAKKTGNTKKKATDVIDAFLDAISENLDESTQVFIPKFGTFKVKLRQSRNGYNPSSKKTEVIPAKKVVSFKAAKKLKIKVAEV